MTLSMTIKLSWAGDREQLEEWSRTELYCLKCGRQGVWQRDDEADFYEENDHLCPGCASEFTLPCRLEDVSRDPEYMQRLELINEAEESERKGDK